MSFGTVNLIAAIGINRQLGLGHDLPWRNSKDPAIVRVAHEDMKVFSKVTQSDNLIAGTLTYNSLMFSISEGNMKLGNRVLWQFTTADMHDIPAYLERIPKDKTGIWVIGGALTYEAFAPYINGVKIITRIPYDGPADTYFPESMLP